MIKLYGMALSGNAYKARLLLELLGLEYEEIPVNLRNGENRTESFLALNPRGQIPTLIDGEVTVWDSQAILVYLARRYGEAWLPTDPEPMAEVMQWLAVAENELLFGLAHARAVLSFGRDYNLTYCQAYGRAGLKVLEQRLAGHEWLAAGRPTIADIACMPYVALSHQGEVPLDEFPSVRAWIDRIRALPGFIPMAGI
ncbi:MAG: glutathione S-transferase N-terminal domain-containing protein [Thiotrichales bacterium]|nr:glutathione S-transferase N-terminal domain-containing protein [Thiotrichales bacterium]